MGHASTMSCALTCLTTLLSGPLAFGEPICRTIDPLVTDPEISELVGFDLPAIRDFDHTACIDPSRGLPSRLLVFLPGSGGLPSDYTEVVRFAAEIGFASVGIAYQSTPSVQELLSAPVEPQESERIRRERLFGEPLSERVEVTRADSIENRLFALLVWLAAEHPSEGWEAFIDAGNERPDWSRIVVAGHSQGAGHAAYLTRDIRLAGAVLFAGPGDNIPGFGPAPWLSRPPVTPNRRTAAFIHLDDPITPGSLDRQRLLGLDAFGPVDLADARPPAAMTSHMLTSARPVPLQDAHGAPVVDFRLPRDAGGENVYESVWYYLLQTARPGSCAADLAPPFGVLDLADINAFTNGFVDRSPASDIGEPFGVFDLADVLGFIASFEAGCGNL